MKKFIQMLFELLSLIVLFFYAIGLLLQFLTKINI